jgi:transcriptional regulator with XRE-family HTH domain
LTKNPALGKYLREIRLSRNMTMTELAKDSGVTKQSISQFELGKSSPQEPTLKRICKALGEDFDEFIEKIKIQWDFRIITNQHLSIERACDQKITHIKNIIEISRELVDPSNTIAFIKTEIDSYLIKYSPQNWDSLTNWYTARDK